MADLADIAQAHIETVAAVAVKNVSAKVYTGKSSLYCCECGEPIPEARREAVPGCSLCIYCQQKKEANRKHGI
jgi:phage/conjugal plasmid C-4 type zinc finger TraR family protein